MLLVVLEALPPSWSFIWLSLSSMNLIQTWLLDIFEFNQNVRLIIQNSKSESYKLNQKKTSKVLYKSSINIYMPNLIKLMKIISYFVTTMKGATSANNIKDLILIRHAQSNFNKGYLDYLEKHQLKIYWDDCIKIEHFNQVVSYAKEHFDCSITQEGVEQCKKARKQLENEQIGIVLVSPYQRALQTCRQIFGNRNLKIQVHPLLAEVFRFSCDIGQRLQAKQKQFTEFDFSHMKDASQLWFIEHLAPHHQENWKQYQEKQQNLTFEQKQEILLQFVKSKVIYESNQQLRERIWKLKEMLLQYRNKYGKVAVVTHYHIVDTILAEQFDQHSENVNPIIVQNAQPYFTSIQHLLQFK